LERQYALAERARSLGFQQVVVIDDDLAFCRKLEMKANK